MSYIFCKSVLRGELEAIQINHPQFNACLLLQGAQLIEFSPKNNQFENLLWLSDHAEYKQGQSIRGGIPICWPWFGNLDKNPASIQQQVVDKQSARAHGFARNIQWSISHIEENCEQVQIELTLQTSEQSKVIWPNEFELTVRFTFSQTLKVELITTNLSQTDINISQALHTYLPTKDINNTYIHNAHNSRYIDALDNWKEKQQVGRIGFSQETDRLYFFSQLNPQKGYSLRVESPKQQLILENENSASAVIWNPWIEKSKRLSQFENDDYQGMFCIETANVLSDCRRIQNGKSEKLKLVLRKL